MGGAPRFIRPYRRNECHFPTNSSHQLWRAPVKPLQYADLKHTHLFIFDVVYELKEIMD